MDNYYVMLHDEKRCIGCQSCTVACANMNNIPKGFARVQVQIQGPTEGRFKFYRVSCQHCEDAPCISVCPTGASMLDEDGIVKVNKNLCIGCDYCVAACPYKIRYVNRETKKADKCDFCVESRLVNGEKPACVSVCITDALHFGRFDSQDIQDWISAHPEAYRDSKNTAKETHLYRNKETHREVQK